MGLWKRRPGVCFEQRMKRGDRCSERELCRVGFQHSRVQVSLGCGGVGAFFAVVFVICSIPCQDVPVNTVIC